MEEQTVFVVTNRIPVTKGQEEAFEDRFRNRAHLIDQSPGFIKNQVLRPVQRRFNHKTGAFEETSEPGYHLVQTWWESEQHFWDWTQSESFRIAHSNRPPAEMFAGPNVMEIHRVILSTDRWEAKSG
jgi:heme-degrading monooxygenase HmoA